jgi:hypothetical protein
MNRVRGPLTSSFVNGDESNFLYDLSLRNASKHHFFRSVNNAIMLKDRGSSSWVEDIDVVAPPQLNELFKNDENDPFQDIVHVKDTKQVAQEYSETLSRLEKEVCSHNPDFTFHFKIEK